jgi:hypothetical protein
MSMPLQTTLAAELPLAGQFLLEEQALKKKYLDIQTRNLKTNSFQKRTSEFRMNVNLNKEHFIIVIPPHRQGV